MDLKTMILLLVCVILGMVYLYVTYVYDNTPPNDDFQNTDNTQRNEDTNRGFFDLFNWNEKSPEENKYYTGRETQILCKALEEATGNKTDVNHKFTFYTNTGGQNNRKEVSNVMVNCYDKEAGIAADYKRKGDYEYLGKGDDRSFEEFYDQVLKDNEKEDFFKKVSIQYIKVPYTVNDVSLDVLGEKKSIHFEANDISNKTNMLRYIKSKLEENII